MLRYIARIIQVIVNSFLLSQMTQPTLSCAIFFPLPRPVDAFRRIVNQALPFRAINLGAGGEVLPLMARKGCFSVTCYIKGLEAGAKPPRIKLY